MTKQIEKVFTPRSSEVNSSMYIRREEIENAFNEAFESGKHIIVHGESGSGKSWLYKNYFLKNDIVYEPANLANASRFGSISNELKNSLDRLEKAKVIEYTETKEAEGSLSFWGWVTSKVKLSHNKKYTLTSKEPYEAILQYIHKQSKKKIGILVLDNLESILNSEKLMEELSNIIILLDDQRYSQYNVKLLLVGTPSNIREYFKLQQSKATINNRLIEVPELPRFSYIEVNSLIQKGFIDLLNYSFNEFTDVAKHIHFVTDGIPDKVHDYCLILAKSTPDKVINTQSLDIADKKWLSQHLSDAYQTIVSLMNSRNTEVGRRNQVLYSLGKVENSEFNYIDVEEIVRSQFPDNTRDIQLAINQILNELSSGNNNILKKSQKKDAYFFTDPIYKMAIRAVLKKKEDETVERIYFEDVR
ncbi:Hypothetical protein LBF_2146 [Leptospira biflexa serovar Patoc strain 'Patoc 1 (Ames)']|uniref:Putative nucleoside triphosphate hydrolase n=1 Tax=Leptospira biflexa serovar Patoc (strain Patoc 1 / ATCC 23582 / Paris) TaxID=456481 RepID=B0ST66_LEPBP|nr:ATP-binding protein [Leptospira biflexa]ABZ94643.1 Hypothetical protein LBF_2146 [Leptospira biflexa serovar Patoc strain 'Patoc 1 (Ames)']ABZ98306.1 Putative nucleoside triphosphate hydrolase [Leptospira biflexa serovar Patoc strain 'Patoc 1 (Paris)']